MLACIHSPVCVQNCWLPTYVKTNTLQLCYLNSLTLMTGKPIIIFLLLINFVLKMDEIKAPPPVPDPRLPSGAVPLPTASKCYWWPFCMSDTSICNGNQKSLCSVYGTNGSKRSEAPSELALARAVDRDQKWKQKCKDRICPWGCGRAVLCGGIKQTSCEKYGTNGTHKHLRPTSNEAKELVGELKKQKKRKRMEDQRANQSPSKKVAEREKNKKSKSDHRANQSSSEQILLESGILRIITRIFISFLDLEIRLTQYNTKWLHSYQLMCYELYSENAVHR